MDAPDESVRAPIRAHILASINPFLGSSEANGDRDGSNHKKRPGRRRRRHSPEKAHGGGDENVDANDDDRLRPRTSKIRFKSKRPETKADQQGLDEHDDNRRTRHRSRDYETDSDKGRDPVFDRDTRGLGYNIGADEDDDATPKHSPKETTNGEGPVKEDDRSRRRHHRRHRHHHRRHSTRTEHSRTRSRTRSRSRTPTSADGHSGRKRRHGKARRDGKGKQEEEDPYADPPLDPDAAFRQSLFDAMADDEGAAYWEAVYGQPVHEYAEEAKARQQQAGGGGKAGPDGVSAMNDEEYADYVRRRMWERSEEGRRETREQQKRQQAATAAAEQERLRAKQRAFEQDRQHWAEVERSLRRGEARRKRRRWQDRWQTYTSAWSTWESSPTPESIPWPVDRATAAAADAKTSDKDSKSQEEAFAKEVRAFFTGGPQDDGDYDDSKREKHEPTTEKSLLARLRDERVRWHPDKMQQRLGGSVGAAVMRDITAIFQVVDRLWGELRGKK